MSPDDGMLMRDGCVYVAPPDYHLITDGRRVPRKSPPEGPARTEAPSSRMMMRAKSRHLTAFTATLDEEIAEAHA